MDVKQFINYLNDGRVSEAVGVDIQSIVQFIKDIVFPRQTSFILCTSFSCGCIRVVHYTVMDLQVIAKPDGSYYSLIMQSELAGPREEKGCLPPEIRMDWVSLPVLGVKVEWRHEEYDAVLREEVDINAA